MKKVLPWILSLVLFGGTIFAWVTVFRDFAYFRTFVDSYFVFDNPFVKNPLATPCFYGAFAFLGGFIWSLFSLRPRMIEVQKRKFKFLSWFLIFGNIFAWTNMVILVRSFCLSQATPVFGCSSGPKTWADIFSSSCFIGSSIFLVALIVNVFIYFLLKQQNMFNRNRAFTLIELLVVISIISLLSTVIFAVFSTSRVQAQDAKQKEEVHQVTNALELYHSIENSYPGNFCTDKSCTTGTRTSPALSSAEPGDGQLQNDYQKSMQQLVTKDTLASIPESSSTSAPFAYYNTGESAVFFTQLTGGYGSIASNQLFPAMVQSNERVNAFDCGDISYDSDYCFKTDQLSNDYQECLSEGVQTYISTHSGVVPPTCADPAHFFTSCDQIFVDPSYIVSNPLNCYAFAGYKFNYSSCPSTQPMFCTDPICYPIDQYPTMRSGICYWAQ
jgi:prepilin-type N-terminal cleavage/methylation domain-containing protein